MFINTPLCLKLQKNYLRHLVCLFWFLMVCVACGKKTVHKLTKTERIREAILLEKRRTQNPQTGLVPTAAKAKAYQKTLLEQQKETAKRTKNKASTINSIANARWQERGPNRVGGRTHAILLDRSDSTRNTLWVGSASGGIWKTTNIHAAVPHWEQVNDFLKNLAISSIVQHPTQLNVMYASTGDTDSEDVEGVGIFKSVDSGSTWQLLSSTTNQVHFRKISELLLSADGNELYAATFLGVFRSLDAGASWQTVLKPLLDSRFYGVRQAANGKIYAFSKNLYQSNTGDTLSWQNISGNNNTFPTNCKRLAFSVAPTNPNMLYIVGAKEEVTSNGSIFKGTAVSISIDGGQTWQLRTQPNWIDGCLAASNNDFGRGQADYNLIIVADSRDPNVVYLGGIDCFKSLDRGQTWEQITAWSPCGNNLLPYTHADQHNFIFDDKNPNMIYLGNDGGVYTMLNRSNENLDALITDKNEGFVTTQFYTAAIHPDKGNEQLLGGTQDNGTWRTTQQGLSAGRKMLGSDGMFTFFDQDEPNTQIYSIGGGEFVLTKDGGITLSNRANSAGDFFTAADYDSDLNTLYAQTTLGDLWRWSINTQKTDVLNIAGVSLPKISTIRVDEKSDINNRVLYFGTYDGLVYKVVGANNSTQTATLLGKFGAGEYVVSCIAIDPNNRQHLLATFSNYGISESIVESTDGGNTWKGSDGDGSLPDMPIRWAIFNPLNTKQVFLATETGVWTTDFINSALTNWLPPATTNGTPIVRTDMLRIRKSDNRIVAATYGRGFWTTDILSAAAAVAITNPVTYVGLSHTFLGKYSNKVERYKWQFGDGSPVDSNENTSHIYSLRGDYFANLIANDTLFSSIRRVRVLPIQVPINFEYKNAADSPSDTLSYGVQTLSGSGWQIGNSTVVGKNGSVSGQNAFVLGLNEAKYQTNSRSILYLPAFDFSKKEIYTLSFFGKWNITEKYDGFWVEYSDDGGKNWYLLNNPLASPRWYNNSDQHFSGIVSDWKEFSINVGFLSGKGDIAFRFVFESSGATPNIGVAIDDIRVKNFTGTTQIVDTKARFTPNGSAIEITWATKPEFFAQRFDIQVSLNGQDFTTIASLNAVGFLSADSLFYTLRLSDFPLNLYYFQIIAHSSDSSTMYRDSSVTSVFLAKRGNLSSKVTKIFPIPFRESLNITFDDFLTDIPVQFELIDMLGRIAYNETTTFDGVTYSLPTDFLANGTYILRITIISTNEAQRFKVVKQ